MIFRKDRRKNPVYFLLFFLWKSHSVVVLQRNINKVDGEKEWSIVKRLRASKLASGGGGRLHEGAIHFFFFFYFIFFPFLSCI